MKQPSATSQGDVLMYLKSVANERNIPYDDVLEIFSESLAQSLRRSAPEYHEADFRVEINRETGAASGFRRWHVVGEDEEVENPDQQMTMAQAMEKAGGEALNAGDTIEEAMEEVTFDQRISMLSAKQYLISRLRDAERQQMLNDLLQRDEHLVSGQVTRILRERGDAIIEVMQVSCRLPKREMLPRESLKVDDRVQALIKETNSDTRGQQIILTRTSPEFLVRLFQRVVPEIEKGVLEVVAAVRAPGARAKIAVRTNDPRVDPVGTCVGIRGSRVQMVTNELNGERIDIIPWDDDPVKYALNALSPAEISRIEYDPERRFMHVLVEPDLMAQAIGKSGTNVRLAAELTGLHLNLCTPSEYQEEKESVAVRKSETLAEKLDLDKPLARILYDEGFETMEQIAYAQTSELMDIEGIDEEISSTIQQRARQAVEEKENLLRERRPLIEPALREMEGVTEELLYDLVAENVITVEGLADLSSLELLEITEMHALAAEELIMRARAHMDALAAEEDESEKEDNPS